MGREELKNRAQVTLVLDKEVVEYIRNYSKETFVPMSRYIEKLVRDDMDKNKGTSADH